VILASLAVALTVFGIPSLIETIASWIEMHEWMRAAVASALITGVLVGLSLIWRQQARRG
jgi:hypothetical protein